MGEGFLQSHAAWVWLVAGLALCALETVAPGAFMIWIGAAAVVVGLFSFAVTMSLSVSLILFAVLAAGFAALGRKVYGGRDRGDRNVVLNDRAGGLIGRVGLLDVGIGPEPGRLRFDDAQWRAQGPMLPAGARVKVTGVARDGSTLVVEAA